MTTTNWECKLTFKFIVSSSTSFGPRNAATATPVLSETFTLGNQRKSIICSSSPVYSPSSLLLLLPAASWHLRPHPEVSKSYDSAPSPPPRDIIGDRKWLFVYLRTCTETRHFGKYIVVGMPHLFKHNTEISTQGKLFPIHSLKNSYIGHITLANWILKASCSGCCSISQHCIKIIEHPGYMPAHAAILGRKMKWFSLESCQPTTAIIVQ